LRTFFKQVSIYGILPVVGKFISFFLVPIYVRIFSAAEFGIVELLITLVNFLLFASNLEFYTAVGRLFYENESIIEKKKLVSTGLYLTLIFTSIVILFSVIFENGILNYYIKSNQYQLAYRLSIIYLFFSAIYTYLCVLPRYDKKPKLYVTIQLIGLLIRVGSTIVYVLYYEWGVNGVIAGQLTGALTSFLLNILISKTYIGFYFSWYYAKAIIKFAIPLIPGLLLAGFWNPLSRSLISNYYSIEAVGYFAFALKITMFMTIISNAINLAFNPMIFEKHNDSNFYTDLSKMSFYVGIGIFWFAIVLTLLAPEIIHFIGTVNYNQSTILIGFLAFQGSIEILKGLRGFGPLINNKTYIYSLTEFIGIIAGVILIIGLKQLGIIGIGFAFLISSVIKYMLLVSYTSSHFKIKYHSSSEQLLIALLAISIALVIFNITPILRYILLLVICVFFLKRFQAIFYNSLLKKFAK